jgi:hypothetical protein
MGLTGETKDGNMTHVDLMLRADGSYFCGNWCDDGVTSIRGNFCPKCSWDDLFYVALHKEQGWPVDLALFWREVFDKVGLHLL